VGIKKGFEMKKLKISIPLITIIMIMILAACKPATTEVPTLTVMTHDSFAISADLVKQYEETHHVHLEFVPSGDAGAMLNRAILTKNSPQADVLYGVDNTFLSRALAADLFVKYQSPLLATIPSEFKLDPENRALPVDYGDVCINYDKAYFSQHNLAVPQSLQDLLNPEYGKQADGKGLLVVENPATSSPGLAFLLATIQVFGEDGYLNYWQGLKDNGVVVANDWNTAYYTNFSGSSGKGAQPMVVSYASSPAAEVIFASTPITEAPTASIIAPGMCFRQVEFVGILKGTKHLKLAQEFVDFMLGVTFQEDMPLQMFVYPVNPQVKLPESFSQYNQTAEKPVTMDPNVIDANRDQWIQSWTEVMLK
jgi:thiamine transport system substrate-binding protein